MSRCSRLWLTYSASPSERAIESNFPLSSLVEWPRGCTIAPPCASSRGPQLTISFSKLSKILLLLFFFAPKPASLQHPALLFSPARPPSRASLAQPVEQYYHPSEIPTQFFCFTCLRCAACCSRFHFFWRKCHHFDFRQRMGFTRTFERNGEKKCEHWSEKEFPSFDENDITLTFANGWESLEFSKTVVKNTAKIG